MPVYGVTFVQDDELAGETWLFLKLPNGGAEIVICESFVTPEVIEMAWAAYRKSIGIPEQRRPVDAEVRTRAAASG